MAEGGEDRKAHSEESSEVLTVLAYVFSHQPAPDVEAHVYEDALRRFHESLAAAPPPGFISSLSYRIEDGYSDWYLLENSSALDVINEAAVTGARAGSHDAAARMAAHGVGKLLSLAAGEADAAAMHELRFEKPAGMGYDELYGSLHGLMSPEAGLWRRMMVLGPPPEFCITCRTPIQLPTALRPEQFERKLI